MDEAVRHRPGPRPFLRREGKNKGMSEEVEIESVISAAEDPNNEDDVGMLDMRDEEGDTHVGDGGEGYIDMDALDNDVDVGVLFNLDPLGIGSYQDDDKESESIRDKKVVHS
ncbi:MAG: Structural maintenance of chromosomes protein 2 [Watsoniomyces obsoletus]|nr:MAG: Structural maintenance of chromosomes protein 2 [Watsoniomyces obsoletus]